jgi:acetone carboxylase gamma subunit
MSIGCHQDPCRCHLPCTCKWPEEDENPRWRDGCERHDTSEDRRHAHDREDPGDPPETWGEITARWTPCPECGELGACGFDAEGRPMVHVTADEEDDSDA